MSQYNSNSGYSLLQNTHEPYDEEYEYDQSYENSKKYVSVASSIQQSQPQQQLLFQNQYNDTDTYQEYLQNMDYQKQQTPISLTDTKEYAQQSISHNGHHVSGQYNQQQFIQDSQQEPYKQQPKSHTSEHQLSQKKNQQPQQDQNQGHVINQNYGKVENHQPKTGNIRCYKNYYHYEEPLDSDQQQYQQNQHFVYQHQSHQKQQASFNSTNRMHGNEQHQQNSNNQPPINSSQIDKSQIITPITERSSALSEFGNMGAAVKNYAQSSKPLFCNSSDDLESYRRADTNKYRQHHGLVVWDEKGKAQVPNPMENFNDLPGLKDVQMNKFHEAGFKAPTPIQAQTWPIAIKERDVVSIAKTGSGKTLAFLLPAYHKIEQRYNVSHRPICVLVLAPTRELAVQIQQEADKFGSIAGYSTAIAYGGAPKHEQLQAIRAGASVLIATPGRLNDFLDSQQVDVSSVFYLVMDEADRMLDMGFEPQIRSILKRLPRKRQTLMFSATWPEEVRRLANDFLFNPIHIRLGDQNNLQANENIHQFLIPLHSAEDKDNEVVKLVKSKILQHGDNILLFVARKNTCNFVANMLTRCGVRAAAMHGDRTQEFREETLASFKGGNLPVLVATDVASRGLDVKGLTAVVNYDMPGSAEDYVHRIGRTGRAGEIGESYTFVSRGNEDIWKVQSIVEIMEKTNQPVLGEIQHMINDLRDRQKRNDERRAAEDEQFEKVLMVAEKPSVAKMIADSLSPNGRYRTRKGKSRANQIFEFIKYFGPAQKKCKLMITSVVGHIFGLSFENQRVQDIATLFDAPVKKIVESTSQKLCIVEHLQELASESQYLYLWLDCDREGENIGFEVISLAQDSINYDNVYRARFSSLTKSELNFAYDNPIKPDKYAALSVDARQELDLKIGVAFTRLMTRKYLDQAKMKFRLKDQKCISYGPCQTPTLWFCAKRHREIQAFRKEKYFVFTLNVNLQGRNCIFKFIKDKVESLQEAQEIEHYVCNVSSATVTEVKQETKLSYKPKGLNTVTLLKACSKGLGMSPTAAMHAAEHLYTSGLISYPRTETTAYSPQFDLVSVLQEQSRNPNWGQSASYLLRDQNLKPPSRGHDAGDHPPITPMRAANRQDMKPNEWKIYDYITRHFIASLHNNFEYSEYTVTADVAGYKFQFTCHTVHDKGFTFAMPWKEKDLKLNETQVLPGQALQGTNLTVHGLNKEEEFTKPPDYLQESELITLMDKHGIGTDASIPQHIKNIQERHYVDVCGPGEDGQKGAIIPVRKFFGKNNRGRGGRGGRGGRAAQPPPPASRHMVPRGFGLAFLSCFENLDSELCEPAIRGYMEEQITKIATGETEKSEVVSSNLSLFKNKFVNYQQSLPKCDRFFGIKEQDGGPSSAFNNNNFQVNRGNFQNNRGGYRGSFHNNGGGGSHHGGRGGYQNKGLGGFNMSDGRGNSFNKRGRGFQSERGKRSDDSLHQTDSFKRQKT